MKLKNIQQAYHFYASIEIYSLETICNLLYCIFITKPLFIVAALNKGLQRLTFARAMVIQEANDPCCGKSITEKLLAIKHLTHNIISHLIVVQTSEMIQDVLIKRIIVSSFVVRIAIKCSSCEQQISFLFGKKGIYNRIPSSFIYQNNRCKTMT